LVSGGHEYDPIVDVLVVPDWGFFSFLLATMASLGLTHIIVAYHHISVDASSQHYGTVSKNRKALSRRVFRVRKTNFVFTPFGKYMVTFFLIIAAILISVGVSIDSFDFQFKGAAGFVLDAMGDNSTSSYSLITLGTALPMSSESPNAPGIRWIQAIYFTFTLAVPLAHLIVLGFLWLVPLKHAIQRRIFMITQVLDAWSALEVFVVSIIAAVLEIQQFAQFIIGNKCDLINEILKKYFHNQFGQGDVCFDVVATLTSGCWTLFTACIVYLISGNLIMRICHNSLKKRKERESSLDITDEELYTSQKHKRSCGGFFVSLGMMLHVIMIEDPYDIQEEIKEECDSEDDTTVQ